MLQPARVLADQGADVVVSHTGPTVVWDREWTGVPPPEARALAVARKPHCDVIVLQRPMRRWFADIIPMLQKLGLKVIVDVDDLFDSIDRQHAAFEGVNPTKHPHHNHEWVKEACRRADLVTCTTPLLAKRYGFDHVKILPNYVPESFLTTERTVLEKTVGWTGTVESHPKDLLATRGAVASALKDTGWNFHVVGTGKLAQETLDLPEPPSVTGLVPYADYPAAMAAIEVGVVPLAQSEFNEAKSALKMMEFAALGVPVLATATYDNSRMYAAGIGNIVKHPSHWYKRLHKLITDEAYREDLAGKGKEVMQQYTYEKNAHRWADAWGIT